MNCELCQAPPGQCDCAGAKGATMDVNIKPIRDFVESSLKRSVNAGVMRGDPVVRVDVAADVAVDAVGMALRMFNEAIGKRDLDAALDQRRNEVLFIGTALVLASTDAFTMSGACVYAQELWNELHRITQRKNANDTASRETGTEAEGRNEVDASEGPAAAATTEGRS